MKPHEFWNSRYSEINIYCQTHLLKIIDNLKSEINLQESVTNKLIRADSMSKDPKIILIRDDYKELFKKNHFSISCKKAVGIFSVKFIFTPFNSLPFKPEFPRGKA